MIDQTTTMTTLAALAASVVGPAVVQIDGTSYVIVATDDAANTRLWSPDHTVDYPSATVAELHPDPMHNQQLIRQALASINRQRQQAEAATIAQGMHHGMVLAGIREYAIEANRDGTICRDGLNQFLRKFDMNEYEPYIELTYELTGRLELASTNIDAATAAVLDDLLIDTDDVNNLMDDTAEQIVAVRHAKPTTPEDGTAGLVVEFVVTGSYSIDGEEVYSAEYDCRSSIQVNADAITGYVEDTLRYSFEYISGSTTE